jgi:hypothetical protein
VIVNSIVSYHPNIHHALQIRFKEPEVNYHLKRQGRWHPLDEFDSPPFLMLNLPFITYDNAAYHECSPGFEGNMKEDTVRFPATLSITRLFWRKDRESSSL